MPGKKKKGKSRSRTPGKGGKSPGKKGKSKKKGAAAKKEYDESHEARPRHRWDRAVGRVVILYRDLTLRAPRVLLSPYLSACTTARAPGTGPVRSRRARPHPDAARRQRHSARRAQEDGHTASDVPGEGKGAAAHRRPRQGVDGEVRLQATPQLGAHRAADARALIAAKGRGPNPAAAAEYR